MNFIEEFKKGQQGGNKGIPMGLGLTNVSKSINGVQRGRVFGIAGASKSGKSTFVDYAFLIQPYLYFCKNDIDIEWIYFLYNDFGITHITLPKDIKINGKSIMDLNPDYLRGRIMDDNDKIIKVNEQIYEYLKIIYKNRIIKLFGEYSKEGLLLNKGKITFIESKDNPTGIYKYLMLHAERYGKFIKTGDEGYTRVTGYNADNPKKYTIVITDHVRKLIPERAFGLKQTVDKYIEYSTEIRNLCNYTFVHIIHTNRGIVSQERLKSSRDLLYPSSDDIKETGSLSEDCDYIFTIFNPNDDRYNLTHHFGNRIKDNAGNELYPNMRTIHLVESRHCKYPQHFKVNMKGNYKNFEKLKI